MDIERINNESLVEQAEIESGGSERSEGNGKKKHGRVKSWGGEYSEDLAHRKFLDKYRNENGSLPHNFEDEILRKGYDTADLGGG